MLSRLLYHSTSVNISSVNQTLLPRTIVSLTRDARLYSLSKIRVSKLSCILCKENGAILTKGHPEGLALVRRKGTAVFDVNTNVSNNVYLYKFEKTNYFKYMNGFGVFQLLFWIVISYVMYGQLPARDYTLGPLTKYINENFFTILIGTTALFIGVGSLLVITVFTAKSVKYIILHKGGNHATFITYHPLNKYVSTTVPIKTLKCRTARAQSRNYLPVKMKGHWFYYILDSKGEFVNPTLFDYTVGTMRL